MKAKPFLKVSTSCNLHIEMFERLPICDEIEKLNFRTYEDASTAKSIVRLFLPHADVFIWWKAYVFNEKSEIKFAAADQSELKAKKLLFSIIPVSYASQIEK